MCTELNLMPVRLIFGFDMSQPIDWLSRLLEMMPVSGRLELRCLYGAPWQVVYGQGAAGDIVYHVVLSGTAMVNDPDGGPIV